MPPPEALFIMSERTRLHDDSIEKAPRIALPAVLRVSLCTAEGDMFFIDRPTVHVTDIPGNTDIA